MRWVSRAVFATVLAACGSSRESEGTSTPLETGIGEVGTQGDASGEAEAEEGSQMPKLDTPDGMEGGGAEAGEMGCKKVDFLFVVDSSGSMTDEQMHLASSFPGFIDVIQQETMVDDFHIMAVDTDAAGFSECALLCQFFPDCNGVPCGMVPMGTMCDDTLGAGKTKSYTGQDCGIAGGTRYITQGQADLANTFSCAAQVGTQGSGDEMAIEAMLAAIGTDLNAPMACNDGFLRDDAILVVTLITDESNRAFGEDAANETPTPGTPDGWYQSVISRKAGQDNAVVALGLIGDNDQPNAICQPLDLNTSTGAEEAPDLRAFIELFGNGVVGSVCEQDYAPFFSSAVSVIESACDDFVPPG